MCASLPFGGHISALSVLERACRSELKMCKDPLLLKDNIAEEMAKLPLVMSPNSLLTPSPDISFHQLIEKVWYLKESMGVQNVLENHPVLRL